MGLSFAAWMFTIFWRGFTPHDLEQAAVLEEASGVFLFVVLLVKHRKKFADRPDAPELRSGRHPANAVLGVRKQPLSRLKLVGKSRLTERR